VLLLRSEQEHHLDEVLKRKEKSGEQPKAFSNEVIRKHLDNTNDEHVLFILIATPVEEVGRDHDFDWAVVEPSSYRSIIQLAGRVRRHRKTEVQTPNISLLQYNWKGVKYNHKKDERVFIRPGFEDKVRLKSHNLNDLLDADALLQRVDAIPRIQKPEDPQPEKQLADLEHCVIKELLANYGKKNIGPADLQGYLREAWFLTACPQQLVPFRQGVPSL